MNLEEVLATISLAVDGGPCEQHIHPLMSGMAHAHGPDSNGGGGGGSRPEDGSGTFLVNEVATRSDEDVRFMLLSLILDLWRRNEYLYQALKHLPVPADSDLAASIAAHSGLLCAIDRSLPVDWKQRAFVTNAVVHRMLLETDMHHSERLERSAGVARMPVRVREETMLSVFYPDDPEFVAPQGVADLRNKPPVTTRVATPAVAAAAKETAAKETAARPAGSKDMGR
jgi:hypothetical protein